ncbi:MAG: IS1380 family transposase [bacterium]
MKSLSLKLKMSNEKITSFGGSIVIADFIKSVGLEESLDALLPKAGSNRGYKPSQKILALISSIILSGEGRYVNIDRLRNDKVFKAIWGFNNIPFSTKIGEWFLNNGKSEGDFATGITKKTIDELSLDLAIKALKAKGVKEIIFDADVSVIEGNKKESKMTYKGFKGVGSLLGFAKGYCLYSDFRNGNVHASVGLLDQLKYIHKKLSDNNIKMAYRSDSAGFTYEIIDYCTNNSITYYIRAKEFGPLKREAYGCEFEYLTEEKQISEFVYSMKDLPVRIITTREKIKTDLPIDVYANYRFIATNSNKNIINVYELYNDRGVCEYNIKELKQNFELDRLPSSYLGANGLWSSVLVLAYNIIMAFKEKLSMKRLTARTIRWFFTIPAKLVTHAGRLFLSLSADKKTFKRILKWRVKCNT